MTDNQLKEISLWFDTYANNYKHTDKDIIDAIKLKIKHTLFVCANIKTIAQSLSLSEPEQNLAMICGLLHDVGRFEQINKFGTFNDLESCDHALLSVEIIKKQNVLAALNSEQQDIILSAIQWHNKKILTKDMPDYQLTFAKILRDADKLDIMRIFMDYYDTYQDKPNSIVEFNLPLQGDYSQEIIEQMLLEQSADALYAKNVNDLRLAKLSWVYDLNFLKSKELFLKRQYIESTLQAIPITDKILTIANKLKKHLQPN